MDLDVAESVGGNLLSGYVLLELRTMCVISFNFKVKTIVGYEKVSSYQILEFRYCLEDVSISRRFY